MTTASTELADRLMATVTGLRRLVRRRVREQLPQLNPSSMRGAQLELLRTVEDEPGIGVAAAARKMHLKGNSVSTLVNQLVDLGMLHREVDPADRRAARLALTPAATERLTTWRRTKTELVAGKLATLSEKDIAVIADALPALGRLLAAIEDPA